MNCMLPPAAWLSIERLNDPSTLWKSMADGWGTWGTAWVAPWSAWLGLPVTTSQPWTSALGASLPWWMAPWMSPTSWWMTTSVSPWPVQQAQPVSGGCVVEASAVSVSTVEPAVEPAVESIAHSAAAADDLTRIEGIGPKIAGILKAGGIGTFAELASTAVARLQALLEAAGPRYRLARPETWSEQAGLLARGDEAGFAALAAALRGGVRA